MLVSPQQCNSNLTLNKFLFCADNLQLTHSNMAQSFDKLKTCLDGVKKLLSVNKTNPGETEFIRFGSKI